MKTGRCRCGNRIFFNNHHCLRCTAELGRCIPCGALTSFSTASNAFTCDQCQVSVHRCSNQTFNVCHSFVSESDQLCKWCAFTTVIPNLTGPENVRRWAVLEAAKRRLLLQLEELGLPPFLNQIQETHPLSFEFVEDLTDNSITQSFATGHQDGVITINLSEADSVHRERLRVQLGEPQRTLIGHMRHEIGHYIDWSWATRVAVQEYHQLFGDPAAIDYRASMAAYYDKGAPADWALSFVSGYATMHPWEDFAETVNLYLDIMAIATTANDIAERRIDLSKDVNSGQLVASVLDIVIEVSEYNFDLGLLPLLPERLPEPVMSKLEYVHALRRLGAKSGE